MFTSGLPSNNDSSTDSLLDILSSPKKAEDTLKKLKSENIKLVKATKDLMKAKSLAVYCKEQEKLAEQAKQDSKKAISSIKDAEKKASTKHTKELKAIETAVGILNMKEKEDRERQKELDKQSIIISEIEDTLEDLQERAQAKLRLAEGLKQEYTDKLNDLKERMRGL